MKKHLQYLKYLFGAILLFLLALFIEKSPELPEDFQIDTEKFGKTLNLKETAVTLVLDSLMKVSRPLLGKKNENLFKYLPEFKFEELNKKGYFFVVYIEDSLRFWSTNSIELSLNLAGSKLNNTVVNLNNAWYYVKNLHEKNLDAFGLVLLKTDYSYQNQYLENKFQDDFNLPETINISKVPLSYGFDIYDSSNNYSFTLFPTNKINSINENWLITSLVLFISIALLFLFFARWLRFIRLDSVKPGLKIISILMLILSFRYLMVEFKIPLQFYALPVYNPENFNYSTIFPSIGDFLINSLIIILVTRTLFYIIPIGKLARVIREKSLVIKYCAGIIALLFLFSFFSIILFLIEILVQHSNIPLEPYKIREFGYPSVLLFIICFIMLASLTIFSIKMIAFSKQIIKTNAFSLILLLISISFAAILYLFNNDSVLKAFPYFIVSLAILFYFPSPGPKQHYSFYVLLITIGSLYLTLFIHNSVKQKDKEKSVQLISELLNERDVIAENMLITLSETIKSDDSLKNELAENGIRDWPAISQKLEKKYFSGYFSKYNLSIELCETPVKKTESGQVKDCSHFYEQIVKNGGIPIENSAFHFVDKHTGEYNYNGIFEFKKDSNIKCLLYIILNSKLFDQETGYPDLLIAGKDVPKKILSGYSYARYRNNSLVNQNGEFPFDLSDKMFRLKSNGIENFRKENFDHTVYQSENNLVVLSKPQVKKFDLLISFSYLFVFFNILFILILSAKSWDTIWKRLFRNFENKLLMSMLFILALSFAMVTAGTVYYNTIQYQTKHYTTLNEKIESVEKSFNLGLEKLYPQDSLKAVLDPVEESKLLKQLSKIYYSDINLYDYTGKLISTSRPEIFEKGLLGEQMEAKAFKEMRINEKSRYIQDEQIGKLEYSSAYALVKTNNSQNPYYINLPYFSKPSELKSEISNLIVTIINLYVVLFLLVALISVFMANKVTQPLRMLQLRFSNIELGRESEQINYDKQDEVGALVKEYNRMVIKLAESIELLAKTERESAWREMAKQIAHEIKNPLTPMKLSVQFLQRSWQDKDDAFDKKLKKCTQTLIDQINTLSNIASEFSSFAKMPIPKMEVVNLVTSVENIFTLFSNTENLRLTTNIDGFDRLPIISDHEHISRAITNLVKNGIQAVPSDREAQISIIAEKMHDKVLITITDNGSGIPEEQKDKLFIPNFTTKLSGMGMGLPIVKDIVEASNGKIWFETELGKGTSFFIEFPLVSEEVKKDNEIMNTENL